MHSHSWRISISVNTQGADAKASVAGLAVDCPSDYSALLPRQSIRSYTKRPPMSTGMSGWTAAPEELLRPYTSLRRRRRSSVGPYAARESQRVTDLDPAKSCEARNHHSQHVEHNRYFNHRFGKICCQYMCSGGLEEPDIVREPVKLISMIAGEYPLASSAPRKQYSIER